MSPDDAEGPPETADALLARLRRLDRDGRIEIVIDPRHLDHIDSPVASEADGNIWIYGLILLAVVAGGWKGVVAGLAVGAAGVVLYLTVGRAYKHRRIVRRVRERGLESVETWRKLWRFQGLVLQAKDRPGLADCASPDGNWMGFVRAFN